MKPAATSNISRRVFSQVSSGEESSADLKIIDLHSSEIRKILIFIHFHGQLMRLFYRRNVIIRYGVQENFQDIYIDCHI